MILANVKRILGLHYNGYKHQVIIKRKLSRLNASYEACKVNDMKYRGNACT